MSAKSERKRTEVYAWDLLWLDVKRHYDDLPRPSDIWYRREKKKDKRSAKQIIQDTLKGLGGE